MDVNRTHATYLYALGQVKGLRQAEIVDVVDAFRDPYDLMDASPKEVAEKLGRKKLADLPMRLSGIWKDADKAIQRHIETGILPIPITDDGYSPLLRLIPDPPPVLFVRGNVSILSHQDTVAVVGTREPTNHGLKTAHQITDSLARSGYVIVSGLAKGIDTAAHTATLEANGRTIAVLGTSLGEVYPAENKALAERIIEESGALVSELPLGKPSSKAAFVQRDRIQSGLSLAVFAIQTDISGGTMHTVGFAKKQGRLVFCPPPSDVEADLKQNAGILHLIRSGRARELPSSTPAVLKLLQEHEKRLRSSRQIPKKGQKRSSGYVPDLSTFGYSHESIG